MSASLYLALAFLLSFLNYNSLRYDVQNFNGRSDTVFCGVFDGHGPHGHLVARKVRDTLPSKLCDLIYDDYGESPTSNSDRSILEETLSPYPDAEDKSLKFAVQKEEHREFFDSMKESFRKAFRVMDKELKLHRNIDSICSGTTAVTLIKQVPVKHNP
jgi:serine/threonine protein phosphatase PrpC